jgi:hypothetical protein
MNKLLPILLLILSALASSQTSLPDGLKVNGVGLGAKYAEVVRKLGKPTRDVTSRKADECIGSKNRTLTYPGLKIELDDPGSGYQVFFFEITSAKWNASRATIGASTTVIQKLFGTRGRTVDNDKSGPSWSYSMPDDNPGASTFYFSGGKLVKMISGYEMC